jgi:hypothetical protein
MTKDILDAKETSCYSYEVLVVVQIIAENRESADEKLDKDGGYVSKREVSLKDVVPLYGGSKDIINNI